MPNVFSQAQLDAIVEETLRAGVPYNKKNAIVAGVDKDGARVVAHFERHPGAGWTLNADAVAEHDWNGDNEVGAHVVLAW